MSAENSKSERKRGRPFKKGQSGNPGGRPKGEPEVRALAQRHGAAAILRLVALKDSDNERVAVAACEALLNRAYGKPPQAVHLGTDEHKGPLRVVVEGIAVGSSSTVP